MRSIGFYLLVAALCLATVGALFYGAGRLDVALVPAFLVLAIYAMVKLPLRYPVFAMTFLALTLENPGDVPGAGIWKSPIYDYGAIFLGHMNLTIPIKALAFSGLDVMLVILFAIAFYRWLTRSQIDGDRPPTASPIGLFAGLTLAGAAWMWLWGMTQADADFGSSLWQVQRVFYLPILFFLFRISLRGPVDADALGGIVLVAACIKAGLAIYLRQILPPPPNEPTLPYATTHADSMLFATALTTVLLMLILRHAKRRLFLIAIVIPLLVAGMVSNNRRIVWVEVIASLLTVWAILPWTKAKRTIARYALFASPAAIAYLLVGWSVQTGIFKPVQVLRSVVDSKADASTSWRDWENYNLFYTVKTAPIFGTGYGHGYIEIVHLPDISGSYSLYRHIPHNSILGLWAYGGYIGFTLLWLMLPVGAFVAARAQLRAKNPREHVIALGAIATVVAYLVHCYGDMGLGTLTSLFTVAPALALAEKLAATSGAFSTSRRPTRVAATEPSTALAVVGAGGAGPRDIAAWRSAP